MKLEGSSALVAGGASGLGAATARRLTGVCDHVVIADVQVEQGRALAKELGKGCEFIEVDVTDDAAVQRAVAAACAKAPLRLCVTCAGIGGHPNRVVGRDGSPHPRPDYERVLNVNLMGTFNVMRLAAWQMSLNEPLDDGVRGCIINTASIAAFDGQVGQIAYSASKGGVVSMTLPAARDLAPVGVRVMTIAPGSFETPLFASLSEQQREHLIEAQSFPKHFGRPEQFAALVQSIAENDFLNGEVIRLDAATRMPAR